MSLKNIVKNPFELNNIMSNKEKKIRLLTKNNILSQIRNHYPLSNTIEAYNKEPLLLKKDNYLIKNNKYLNYLNNIMIQKKEYKNRDSELNKSNSNSNFSSFTKNAKISEKRSLSNKKLKCNSPNYIKLNSLFTLPSISKTFNRYNSNKSFNTSNNFIFTESISSKTGHPKFRNESNLSKLRINLFNQNSQSLKKKKRAKYSNLFSFMKFKYYDDIHEKLEKKLKDESFLDRGVKDKIIKIGKFGVFWRNVIEYCSPLVFTEKYKNIKKHYIKNSYSQDVKSLNGNNRVINKILYTSILRTKLIHEQYKKRKDIQ